jgi:hypothetical protein
VAEDTTFGESHRILGEGETPSMSILYLGRYEFKMLVEMARMVSDYRYGTGTFGYSHVVFICIFNSFWQHFHTFFSLVLFEQRSILPIIII